MTRDNIRVASRNMMRKRYVSLHREDEGKGSAASVEMQTSPAGVRDMTSGIESKHVNRDPVKANSPRTSACVNESILSDYVLLQICRASPNADQVTPEWMSGLRSVARLIELGPSRQNPHLEHAVTLIASLLRKLPQYNPRHFPFGYGGPHVNYPELVGRDDVEYVGKQLMGLVWIESEPSIVASDVTHAVTEAIRLGFLREQEYDAWRPGMRSGSGWRSAVMPTPYGLAASKKGSELSLSKCPNGRGDVRAQDRGEQVMEPMEQSDEKHEGVAAESRQYHHRLWQLHEAEGSLEIEESDDNQSAPLLGPAASKLANDLDLWIEAVSDADADERLGGGFWTTLGNDLEELLGPAQLETGLFEDEWTPLLTTLRIHQLSAVADELEKLAEASIPLAHDLARAMDGVAYLTNGGPRDAMYEYCAKDELWAHKLGVMQGRQDVGRAVKKIVVVLRSLAANSHTAGIPAVPPLGIDRSMPTAQVAEMDGTRGTQTGPDGPEYVFAKKGMWTIRFAGKETFLDGNLKGAAFIHHLLSHQDQRIHVVRLMAHVAGVPGAAVVPAAECLETDRAEPDEVVDRQTIKSCQDRYERLVAERERASDERICEIESEIAKIAAYLSSALGLGRRSRTMGDEVNKARRRIARVINTAFQKIDASDPDLAKHLRNSVKTHTEMVYEPDREVHWVLS